MTAKYYCLKSDFPTDGFPNAEFLFKTKEELEKFKYTFRDHLCNVPWKETEVVERTFWEDRDYLTLKDIDKKPEDRAWDSLSWGWSWCDHYHIGTTKEQDALVASIVARVSNG